MVQMEIISRVFRIVFGTSTGTAFTIEDHGVQFLVPAKHIFKSANHPSTGKIALLVEKNYQTFDVEIRYPADQEIDIAVMKVTPYQQLTPMFENENTTKGLALGQDVYFLGFPYQYDQLLSSIPGDSKPLPFVKKACLSTILTDNKSILLLDGHNNPGFSGGPVCFKEIGSGKKAMAIAGIVSGYRFDRQYVFDENDTQTKSYVKDNTGIIIAHCISHANKIASEWV